MPNLRSFDVNHISIEPTDIPPDATIGVTALEVRPQDRCGVVVRFPMQISHGALVLLVDEAGMPLPAGSTATLRAAGAAVPVGYDDNAYVQDLGLNNELDVERPDGRPCSVAFDYRTVPRRYSDDRTVTLPGTEAMRRKLTLAALILVAPAARHRPPAPYPRRASRSASTTHSRPRMPPVR